MSNKVKKRNKKYNPEKAKMAHRNVVKNADTTAVRYIGNGIRKGMDELGQPVKTFTI